MKKYLKFIMSFVLALFLAVNAVNAAAQEIVGELGQWKSIIHDIQSVEASNNCSDLVFNASGTESDGITYFPSELFIVKENSKKYCVMTAKKSSSTEGYNFLGEADNGNGGTSYRGTYKRIGISASGYVTPAQIVKAIYESDISQKVSAAMMEADVKPENAVAFEVKAGSDDTHIYIYGAYLRAGASESDAAVVMDEETYGMVLNFNSATKKITYTMPDYDDTNNSQRRGAIYKLVFARYLVDYTMAGLNDSYYAQAKEILNDSTKRALIDKTFLDKYGTINYPETTGKITLTIDFLASSDLNQDIVAAYERGLAAQNGGNGQENNDNNVNQDNTDNSDDQDIDNVETGSFVSGIVLVILVAVGTLIVVNSKQKVFKI